MGNNWDVATPGLAGRLRDARRKANLSQSALARVCGIPKTMISRYENGHIDPSIATLLTLAAGLGAKPSELLDSLLSHGGLSRSESLGSLQN